MNFDQPNMINIEDLDKYPFSPTRLSNPKLMSEVNFSYTDKSEEELKNQYKGSPMLDSKLMRFRSNPNYPPYPMIKKTILEKAKRYVLNSKPKLLDCN